MPLEKMTKIDLNNGKFFLNGEFFQSEIDTDKTDNHTIANNLYSNRTMNGEIKNIPFKATGYYKNKKLKNITLTLNQEYIKERYQPKSDIDFRDYLTPYIDFYKTLTEQFVDKLMNSKKRKFEWGKVQIQIDPRDPTVFVEIKYYKKRHTTKCKNNC